MDNRVLMIAFHFPPFRGSSGLQRTVSFSRYLPAYGWSPVILTAHPRAYLGVDGTQLADISASVPVKRAFAADTARHLSLNGRYFQWMALPDRWVSWFLWAVPAGLRLARKYRPKVLWSTYPIATAHLIGLALHRLTGIPWVADFRDPMVEFDPLTQRQFPPDPALRQARCWVERQTVRHCSRAVFVAPGALQLYADRYPDVPSTRWALIPNGFDEEAFAGAERIPCRKCTPGSHLVLLHSGELYPSPDRDPTALFEALARLRAAGKISSANLRVMLRGSLHEEFYRDLIGEHGIEDIVTLKPPIPYREALAEMLGADGLLLFQGRDSNPAIPAKLYEYLRARRPMFAMVHAEGDTAKALRSARVGKIVPMDSSELIVEGLLEFLEQVRAGKAPIADHAEIQRHSRESRARELAQLLDALVLCEA